MDKQDYEALVGNKIVKVEMSLDHLRLTNDIGKEFTYVLTGGCCSSSYFYDVQGVKNLLGNGAITEAKDIDVTLEEKKALGYKEEYVDQFYGVALTTISPTFGEVTTVFSYRNVSNGYYGGDMEPTTFYGDISKPITEDTTLV